MYTVLLIGHICDHGARKLPSVEQQHQPRVIGQRLAHGKHVAPGWSKTQRGPAQSTTNY